MNNATKKAVTMSPVQFLAIPSTALPAARFADEDDAWRSDVWEVLRECAREGTSPREACGSDILVWSAEWVGPRRIGDAL